MGLVVVLLTASVGSGYDPFPDPLGWLLVLVGAVRLPEPVAGRRWLVVLAVLAGAVSVPLWSAGGSRAILGLDDALRWVLELPRVGFVLLLALALSRAAEAGGDQAARAWWRCVLAGAVGTAVLPPVVYGAGVTALAAPAAGVATATILGCLALCFAHAARPWIQPPLRDAAGPPLPEEGRPG